MDISNISKNLLFSQKHFDLILKLNKTSFVDINDHEDIIKEITETLVDGLDIDRASYWIIKKDNLVCINLFDKTSGFHSSGDLLPARDLPIYFKALEDGIAIVADDVLTNQYTQELKDVYLIPLGITDMLDLPIRENGKVTGVICCEHRDEPRIWSESDLAFAKAVADILMLLIEKNKRRLITNELLENQRKLSLITETSKDVFVVFENSQVSYISPSYANYLGYSNEEALQFSAAMIFDRIHPEDVEGVKSYVYDQLSKKNKNFKCQFRFKMKTGRYIWREDSASVIYDNEGLYSKYVLISRDISYIKKAEAKIDKLYKLSKIQNLKLLDFTHIISHNIRSNTSNMTMLIDLIGDSKNTDEKEEFYKLLKQSNEKLSTTIHFLNDTISLQLNSKAKKYQVNLKEEADKAIVSIENLMPNFNVKISNKISNLLNLLTIPVYLESVLFNLISNGIKYSDPTKVAIVEIDAKKRGSKTVITVSDNGIGIDMKRNSDKLFGMYKTFHGNQDAIGLGLFMTKNHVEALGGTIEVKSTINIGTEFKVLLNE